MTPSGQQMTAATTPTMKPSVGPIILMRHGLSWDPTWLRIRSTRRSAGQQPRSLHRHARSLPGDRLPYRHGVTDSQTLISDRVHMSTNAMLCLLRPLVVLAQVLLLYSTCVAASRPDEHARLAPAEGER